VTRSITALVATKGSKTGLGLPSMPAYQIYFNERVSPQGDFGAGAGEGGRAGAEPVVLGGFTGGLLAVDIGRL
jgi:hypothetical protein